MIWSFTKHFVISVFVLLTVVACSSPGGTGAVKYPPSWPYKDLVAPVDAAGRRLNSTEKLLYDTSSDDYVEPGNSNFPGYSETWLVAYTYKGDFPSQVAHYNIVMKGIGFLAPEESWSGDMMRRYISKDGKTLVQIVEHGDPFDADTCTLTIRKSPEPVSYMLQGAKPID